MKCCIYENKRRKANFWKILPLWVLSSFYTACTSCRPSCGDWKVCSPQSRSPCTLWPPAWLAGQSVSWCPPGASTPGYPGTPWPSPGHLTYTCTVHATFKDCLTMLDLNLDFRHLIFIVDRHIAKKNILRCSTHSLFFWLLNFQKLSVLHFPQKFGIAD